MSVLMKAAALRTADALECYPDLAAAGDLAAAVGTALAALGSSLPVSGLMVPEAPAYARVERASRFSQVYIAAQERLFLVDFWQRGAMLAQAQTSDLHEMSCAIQRWLASECSVRELAAEFGCVRTLPEATAYERGEEVERRWHQYLDSLPGHHAELKDFVAAAAADPNLRQLFPFTSLNRFCFSRCTGYPFTHDIPHVAPCGSGTYEVIAPSGESLGYGPAGVAVRLVISGLPPGCGPAVAGTADDLGDV